MTAAGLPGVASAPRLPTLGDALFPASLRRHATTWQRDALLVAAGTALLIAGAYVSFTVPAIALGGLYVPVNEYVPLTLQTFGVLFTGALLGARRAVSATGLYLVIGALGFPVFAADAEGVHRSGLETIVAFEEGRLVLGATGGYLVGFVVAAVLVGALAQRGWDRRLRGSIGAMLLGTVVIYALGVSWLAIAADLALREALAFGLFPFLPGDILKLLVAAGLLPLGWRLVSVRASDGSGDRPAAGGSGGRPAADASGGPPAAD